MARLRDRIFEAIGIGTAYQCVADQRGWAECAIAQTVDGFRLDTATFEFRGECLAADRLAGFGAAQAKPFGGAVFGAEIRVKAADAVNLGSRQVQTRRDQRGHIIADLAASGLDVVKNLDQSVGTPVMSFA
jgi:hypothetical protein